MNMADSIRAIVGRPPVVIETAEVVTVGTGVATVYRLGQTTATRSIPIADGLTIIAGDIVEVHKFSGNINTALIARKVR